MVALKPGFFSSGCQSYTADDSSFATSLYSTSSIELLDNAQYIYSLHEQSQHAVPKSGKSSRTYMSKDDEKYEIVTREVGRNVYAVGMEWSRTLYRTLANDKDIEEFLKIADSGFDIEQQSWTTLPVDPKNASELNGPLVNIISSIINHFYPALPSGVTREVVDTHQMKLVHENGKHYSQPSISIKAGGSSFQVTDQAAQASGIGYANVAGVIQTQVDRLKGSRRQQAEQAGVPCRQIFLQQPNRNFARSLHVTEKHFRLVHYDHSGIYVTPLLSIHGDKEMFVRFILGLSSPNEADLGLDDSVQWTIDTNTGRKVAGTIKVNEYDDEKKISHPIIYDLDMSRPPFVRQGIRGRGTVAWHATHPTTGEPLIVKDAWRTDTRSGECDFLLAARGIPGVVQLVGYEDRCAETINYRPQDFEAPQFHNRVKLRLVLKKYGPCVSQFKTRLSLFEALRDAFIGHRKLLDKDVLHRDISLQNILFGSPDATEGDFGILIDLDMAVWADGWTSPAKADARVGTRMYQSIAVCRSLSVELVPAQTYLDDLESFFYVITHLVFGFCKPGCLLEDRLTPMKHWNSDDQELVAEAKNGYSLGPLPLKKVPAFWGKPCRTFLKEFHGIIREILTKKAEIRDDEDFNDDERLEAYKELVQQSDVYFEQAKAAFDKVIAALEEEGLNAEELEVVSKTASRSASSSTPAPGTAVAPGACATPVAAPNAVAAAGNPGDDAPSTPPPPSSVMAVPEAAAAGPPAASSAGEQPLAETLPSSGSSGAGKKRPSDDGAYDGSPRKRHRNEEGVTVPPPELPSKPRTRAAARNARTTSALSERSRRRSSRSPAS